MDRLHSPEHRPFADIRAAAIAIRETDPKQRHLGMLYRDTNSHQVFFLHLAWHFKLVHEAPRDDYAWVDPTMPARRLVQLAAICRQVWRANGANRIPYGFAPPSDALAPDTSEYLFGPTGFGLTCATFVLAVFHRAGLPLVHYETWPLSRPGDEDWQQRIVAMLRQTPDATAEHVKAVAQDIGITVRYRPEEVAAAAVTPIPAHFDVAEAGGRKVLTWLRNPQAPQRKHARRLASAFSVCWGWLRGWFRRR
jgi:hypothetical protein